ncbi:GFA family protein [Phyllobacterium sp. K27]
MTEQPGLIKGGCLCGRVRFHATALERTHLCHCDMCRRATGSPFAVLSWIKAENLHWESSLPKQRRSSPLATRSFCGDCGTPIALIYDASDEIAVYAGTLDQPQLAVPTYNYNDRSRLPWVLCGSCLPNHPATEDW